MSAKKLFTTNFLVLNFLHVEKVIKTFLWQNQAGPPAPFLPDQMPWDYLHSWSIGCLYPLWWRINIKSLSMKQIGGKGRDKIFPVHMIGKANLRNFLSMEVVRNVFVVTPKDLWKAWSKVYILVYILYTLIYRYILVYTYLVNGSSVKKCSSRNLRTESWSSSSTTLGHYLKQKHFELNLNECIFIWSKGPITILLQSDQIKLSVIHITLNFTPLSSHILLNWKRLWKNENKMALPMNAPGWQCGLHWPPTGQRS